MLAGPTQPTNTAAAAGTSGSTSKHHNISRKRTDQSTAAVLTAVTASIATQPTDSQSKYFVQNTKHATRENCHLTEVSYIRSQPIQQQWVLIGEAAAAARNSMHHTAAATAAAACTRANRHTDGSQERPVRFLTQARYVPDLTVAKVQGAEAGLRKPIKLSCCSSHLKCRTP